MYLRLTRLCDICVQTKLDLQKSTREMAKRTKNQNLAKANFEEQERLATNKNYTSNSKFSADKDVGEVSPTHSVGSGHISLRTGGTAFTAARGSEDFMKTPVDSAKEPVAATEAPDEAPPIIVTPSSVAPSTPVETMGAGPSTAPMTSEEMEASIEQRVAERLEKAKRKRSRAWLW